MAEAARYALLISTTWINPIRQCQHMLESAVYYDLSITTFTLAACSNKRFIQNNILSSSISRNSIKIPGWEIAHALKKI